jgi:ribose/xylose/arabinose/galactoside ABC-type transport system permease subunit
MANGGHPFMSVLIMIAMGTALGSINGIAVAYLKMVPFVVTLSMMAVSTGASVWLTRNVSVSGLPIDFIDAIVGSTGGIPNPVYFAAIGALVLWVLMKRTIIGRWLYAVGVNARTAAVCGVPVQWVVFGTYAASGLLAGVTAIMVVARLESASPTMGSEGVVLNVIGAAVVGGASIYGGIGSSLGAVVGAIFITLITNSMNMMHIPYHSTLIVKGFVIIAFVAADSLNRKRTAGRV